MIRENAAMTPRNVSAPLTRREMLCRLGGGFGALGLASALAADARAAGAPSTAADPLAPKVTHFPARAKRVIYLFMNGGPSHVDTFDPKPALATHHGEEPPKGAVTTRKGGKLMKSPFEFRPCGQS